MKRLVALALILPLAACATVDTAATAPQEPVEPTHVVAFTGDSVTLRMWNSWENEEAAAEAAIVCAKIGKRAEFLGDSQAPTPTRTYGALYGGSSFRYEHDFVFACLA